MKKETKSKTTQDQLFETTPVSESAERLGQTFAQEWARIENGHRYWRNAVCMLVFGLLVTGVLFGTIFSGTNTSWYSGGNKSFVIRDSAVGAIQFINMLFFLPSIQKPYHIL